MARTRVPRSMIWVGVGLVIAGLGIAFLVAGLDDADKYASVVGAVCAVIGLGLSASALVRRPSRGGARAEQAGGQRVRSATVGGGLLQVRNVDGDVNIQREP